MTTQAARQVSHAPVFERAGVKAPSARVPASRLFFIRAAAILLFLFAIALIRVSQQALVAENSMEISILKTSLRSQETANEKIRVENIVLQSPGRLEQLASAMGMIRPESVTYLVLPAETRKTPPPPRERGLSARVQELLERAGKWR